MLIDADGVYALSALCTFTTTPATQVRISKNEGGEVELFDSESDSVGDDLRRTPLSCALALEDKTIVQVR